MTWSHSVGEQEATVVLLFDGGTFSLVGMTLSRRGCNSWSMMIEGVNSTPSPGWQVGHDYDD